MMKLLIDIDDEMVCNDIKNKALEPTSETDKVIINALYNGISVSNEGDLIGRSELKSVLKNECFWCANRDEPCDKSCWHCINEKIDNAPTVNVIQYKDWYLVNKAGAKELLDRERPQGTWTNKHFEHADCSLCGRTNDYHGDFCKYCGADMRGNEK